MLQGCLSVQGMTGASAPQQFVIQKAARGTLLHRPEPNTNKKRGGDDPTALS